MPAKKSSKITSTKLRKGIVAKGMIEGKSDVEIARQLGVKDRRVRTMKGDPEVQIMLQELLAPLREDIEKAIKRTLETIIEDLDAPLISKLGFIVKDADTGQPLPDRQARSQARNDLIKMLARAQPKPSDNQTTTLTLNQLTLIAESYKQEHMKG